MCLWFNKCHVLDIQIIIPYSQCLSYVLDIQIIIPYSQCLSYVLDIPIIIPYAQCLPYVLDIPIIIPYSQCLPYVLYSLFSVSVLCLAFPILSVCPMSCIPYSQCMSCLVFPILSVCPLSCIRVLFQNFILNINMDLYIVHVLCIGKQTFVSLNWI